jgi:replicative DNA helicase
MIQDIVNGELVMGPDSTPRTVSGVTKGHGDMYEIIPNKGDSFICNADHVLSLKSSYSDSTKYPFDSITNISIKDYLNMNQKFKDKMKLWRTDVDFKKQDIEFDSYIIGVYLAEGTKKEPRITIAKNSPEILKCFNNWLKCNNLSFGYIDKKNNYSTYNIISNNKDYSFKKYILTKLINENNERNIPQEYLINSKNIRLDLLAGLLDGDGYYSNGCYEIICKDESFADQICFLSRSLGLACYKSEKIGTIKKINFKGKYYRCIISGNVSIIPCKVKRKIAKKRKQIKDVLKTGFKVEYIGKDDYYGFSLDKDHLYLMGDFTVTHNTFMSIYLAHFLKKKTLILIDTKKIIEQ